MAKNEFLCLTDWKTGAPVFLDVSQISCIRQITACKEYPRRTRIDMALGSDFFLVSEEALEIALKSGRGFYGLDEPEIKL
jgi:hypothetical protein